MIFYDIFKYRVLIKYDTILNIIKSGRKKLLFMKISFFILLINAIYQVRTIYLTTL